MVTQRIDEPVLTMDQARLRAEPGGQAQLTVTVQNPGHLVESFRLDVVGLDPTWWQVHPPELPVYPGQQESAVVVLSPPATAQAPEDALPFGVRAISTLDGDRSVVEEGDLEVGRILDLQGAISPVTSRGRWTGRHRITYTNWGNSPARLRLTVSDKDEALGFRLTPDQLSVPVGGSASARLRVRPRSPFLRGSPVHRAFQVVGQSSGSAQAPGTPRSAAARAGVPDPSRPVLDGAMQQLPVFSRGIMLLAGLLVAAIVGLVVTAMRTGGVQGATVADTPPDPPANLTAAGISANSIQLKWQPSDRATGYQVKREEPGTGRVLAVQAVADGLTQVDDKPGQAQTSFCYQVVALRKVASPGRPSDQVCAQTLAPPSLDPPTNVQVSAASPGMYRVTWTDNPNNTHVVLVDGNSVGSPVPAGQVFQVVPIGAGQHAVAVTAVLKDLTSRPSHPVNVSAAGGPSATSSAGQAGGGAGGNGGGGGGASATPSVPTGGNSSGLAGWVAVVGYEQSLPIAQGNQQFLAGSNVQTTIVPSAALPAAGGGASFPYLLVVKGFTGEDAARQFCASPPTTLSACQPLNAG